MSSDHSTIPFPDVPGVEFMLVKYFPAYCAGTDGTIWSRWIRGAPHRFGVIWRRMKRSPMRSGYWIVKLRDPSGASIEIAIHRLVLEAFVGPCPEGMQGCHNDGNPFNNALSNLRWDFSKGNHADALRHGTRPRGECHGCAKLTEDDVGKIRADLRLGSSQSSLAIRFGVTRATISHIARRRLWAWLAD